MPASFLKSYTYDSIVSVTVVHPDTFIVNSKRVELYYLPPVMGNPPVQVFNSNIVTDTVFASSGNKKLQSRIFEDIVYGASFSFYTWDWTFIDSFCQDKIIVLDTFGGLTTLSGSQREHDSYYEGAGIYLKDFYSTNGAAVNHVWSRLVYYNFNGCKAGTYFPLYPQSVRAYYGQSDKFRIYPNPTSSTFNIESGLEWQKADIISLEGKIVQSFDYNQRYSMDLNAITHGLYFIKISSKTGNYIYKILKE